jgi:putative tryptophan/tyrosine transport system substrate-binding protein
LDLRQKLLTLGLGALGLAMQRRKFIALVSGAAAAWPLAGWAQQARRQHRIAFVHSGIPAGELTETAGPFWVRRFYQTLRGLGYAEGSNIVVERYSAEGRSQHFASLAAAVVGSDPQVIVVNLNDLIEAFAAATTTIPIVAIIGDPIATGLVANLAHPGGNLTGVSIDAGYQIVAKRLQILEGDRMRKPFAAVPPEVPLPINLRCHVAKYWVAKLYCITVAVARRLDARE